MNANMTVIKTQSEPNSSNFAMGKTSSVTAPDSLKRMPTEFRFARATGGRTCTDCPPTIHFVFAVRERLSTSNENGGYHDVSLKVKFV